MSTPRRIVGSRPFLPPTSRATAASWARTRPRRSGDLKAHQAIVLPLVGRYGGRIIDTAGDGILAEFPSVINATECAVEIQTVMATQRSGARVAPHAVPHWHQPG